ncbi:N-6 DNA methylase [Pseudomonas aeruginosa]|uniref:N-6 DNA methylase n=1 Tax=Pseudomonas aeruginosa TaxID=287 RepID=UPI00168BE008|nr:N-6 DNA methylase [Pseudomonas aeruginosa]MBD3154715.1 N-6 DNA methylase [Pseudomonas aeruginosa]MCM8577257.1 N-6 DNA methylase [Pseudomonas aeruginosa]HDV4112531.1 N-6 DNA methylase [Pseudomonas aeruginosa]HDV4166982.1 N-6 DNA methylase [Pseudomonas aeruginosa]HDV4180121.1 N-6 DNA methylase [Pseudomonas aeruginosa]
MLDTDTKRRIDSCRDILVGKVPDPKSQVEQITIALIYKFMDDMDAQSEEFGGKRSFFVNGFEKYSWSKLLAPSMGGQDTLNLYSEAIGKMTENTHLPALFRDIFKNAYLPYRDPETLKAFLKEIDGFSYDHSERLGDAFEYLLSVLGSQGDAGQFRTPRHIIDFIVKVINPQKHERVLDPACGTAGFLISAWKHILAQNQEHKPGDKLTPDERNKLAANIHGYDISPDMVRLSLVNLYLHGFTNPHVDEYDTLTSEDKWNEHADVILANPPFMSPKGGIKPHKRFSIQATRSEVLFVDYIHEHLSPNGRAGIIVPEGIIFQSGTAYRALRKLLVQNSLVAVISLPAGLFQPYSGVKTSILILDKRLAKQIDKVLFLKIGNDGFSLGAQRRPIQQNDLPQALQVLTEFFTAPSEFESDAFSQAQSVDRNRIAENGEWNLSADRYVQTDITPSQYKQVAIETVIDTISPPAKLQKESYQQEGRYPIIDQSQNEIAGWTDEKSAVIFPDKPFVIFGDHTCAVKLARQPFSQGADGIKIIRTADNLLPEFLFHFLKTHPLETDGYKRHFTDLKRKTIPLPPIMIQREIVDEIEGYQKIIDGATQVVSCYKPRIDVNPDFPLVELGEICDVKSGGTPDRSEPSYWSGNIPWIKTGQIDFGWISKADEYITEAGMMNSSTRMVPAGTVLMAMYGQGITRGKVAILGIDATVNQACAAIIPKAGSPIDRDYLFHVLASKYEELRKISDARGGNQSNLNASLIRSTKIPLPALDIQRKIAEEISTEQSLIKANKELIARFEAKIKAAIERVWVS